MRLEAAIDVGTAWQRCPPKTVSGEADEDVNGARRDMPLTLTTRQGRALWHKSCPRGDGLKGSSRE